jgi:hypothetical protein
MSRCTSQLEPLRVTKLVTRALADPRHHEIPRRSIHPNGRAELVTRPRGIDEDLSAGISRRKNPLGRQDQC